MLCTLSDLMAHGYNVLSIQRTNRRSPQVYVVTRFDCTSIILYCALRSHEQHVDNRRLTLADFRGHTLPIDQNFVSFFFMTFKDLSPNFKDPMKWKKEKEKLKIVRIFL